MLNIEKRLLEISYKHKLSHLSSCLTSINIIDLIYSIKKEEELFCMGNSHAALALYVVLEKYYGFNAEDLYKQHGTHANRDLEHKIFVSGGSLGIVESIALGMAISNPDRNVYLLSSDGGTNEGLFWETLRIVSDYNIKNLKWYINANGFGAYCKIDTDKLERRIKAFDVDIKVVRTNIDKYPEWLHGINGHYCVLDEERYSQCIEIN